MWWFFFSFLRPLDAIFYGTNLHSNKKGMRFPSSPHLCQHSLFLAFLIIAILTGVRQYLLVVLICISQMIIDVSVGHLHVFSGKMSIQILCPFFTFFFFWFGFLVLSCVSSIYLDINFYLIQHSQLYSHIRQIAFSFC